MEKEQMALVMLGIVAVAAIAGLVILSVSNASEAGAVVVDQPNEVIGSVLGTAPESVPDIPPIANTGDIQ